MVVEDTEFNVEAIKMLLKDQFGMEPITAENGEVAVELYTELVNKPCKCPDRVPKLIYMDL